MYKDNQIIAIIPARGGSKGIPHKNIIDLCGKPLIQYTIEAALKSRYLDYVLVSTDDERIAEVSRQCGAQVPFLRPAQLASDTARTVDAVLHGINALHAAGRDFTDLVLLQPTSPLRSTDDIDDAIELYFKCRREPLISVCEVNDNPILIRTIDEGILTPLLNLSGTCRRQDMPVYYRLNGCIYINPIERLDENTSFGDNIIPYIMKKSHSVDIDEFCDLSLAEYYLRQRIG